MSSKFDQKFWRERKIETVFPNFSPLLRNGEGMSGSQRLPLSSSQHHQSSRPCPGTNSPPTAISRQTLHPRRVQLIAQGSSVRDSLSNVALSALDQQSLGGKFWQAWFRSCTDYFPENVEIGHFGCFISKFILPNSHGKPHGVAVERTAPQACPRSIIQSNLPGATKNCSWHSKQSI